MGLVLVTPASSAPVTLAEAKSWCRVSGTANDERLSLALAAAVGHVEGVISRTFGSQVWKLTLPAFADTIELPNGPVVSIEDITYIDAAGDEQIVDAALYTLDMVSNPARVVRNSAASWPDHRGNAEDAIAITYAAGYDGFTSAEADLKAALLELTDVWYSEGLSTPLPSGVVSVLSRYRRILI